MARLGRSRPVSEYKPIRAKVSADPTHPSSTDVVAAVDTESLVVNVSSSDVISSTDGTVTSVSVTAVATESATGTDVSSGSILISTTGDSTSASDAGNPPPASPSSSDATSAVDAGTLVANVTGTDFTSANETFIVQPINDELINFDSSVSGTAATPGNALGASDGTYTTDANTSSWTHSWHFPAPSTSAIPAGANQDFTLRVRKFDGTGNPTITTITPAIETSPGTWTDQTAVSGTPFTVTSLTSQDVTFTIPTSIFASAVAYDLRLNIAVTAAGGGPSARATVQIDSATWTAHVVGGTQQIAGSDTAAVTDAATPPSATLSSADTASFAEASSIVVLTSSSDTAHVTEASTIVATPPTQAEAAALAAEASSIVASISSQDTGNGTETGPSPPATLASSDATAAAEGQPRIAFTAATDSASATEASSIVASLSNSDSATTAEDQFSSGTSLTDYDTATVTETQAVSLPVTDSDAFGTTVETEASLRVLDGDLLTATETEVAPDATLSAGEVVSATEAVGPFPFQGDDAASANDGADPSIGIFSAQNPSVASESFVQETISITDGDSTSATEGSPARIMLVGTDPGAWHFTDASTITASVSSSDATAQTAENAQSPLVNTATGKDFLTGTEGATAPPAVLSSSDAWSLTDAEAVDRGTPPERMFRPDPENRTYIVTSYSRVFQVPAESRLTYVASESRTFVVPAESRSYVVRGGWNTTS
jgi:hypothetical protein